MSLKGAELCARFEAALPTLLDLSGEEGPLDAAERSRLLEHEAACPRCAELRKSYAATVGLLRALPLRHAPPDFLEWVRRGIESAGRPRRAAWSAVLWLSAAAVLALGATLSFNLVRQAPAPPEVARVGEHADRVAPGAAGEAEVLAARPEARSALTAAPAPPAASVAAPEPLFALRIPVAAGWAEELRGLETDLRARFESPLKKEDGTAAFLQDAGARQAQDVSRRGRSQERFGEPPRAPAAGTESAPAPAPRPAGTAEKLPAAGEFTLAIDPGRLLDLLARLNQWARERGGGVEEAKLDLGSVAAAAEGDQAAANGAAVLLRDERTAAGQEEAESTAAPVPAEAGGRLQVRIRVQPARTPDE